jgi:hypothetical protein
MPIIHIFLWTALGAFCSLSLPLILKFIGVPIKTTSISNVKGIVELIKNTFTLRILAITGASLILALIIVALLGDDIDTWNVALINGWCWQSFLARLATPGT